MKTLQSHHSTRITFDHRVVTGGEAARFLVPLNRILS